MRTISRSAAFRRDFKRALSNPRHRGLEAQLAETVRLLAADLLLPARLRDHALTGRWSGYRECHVKPDLLLVYEKVGATMLGLVRLSTHSDIFGR